MTPGRNRNVTKLKPAKEQNTMVSTMLMPVRVVIEKDAKGAELLLEEQSRQASLGTPLECCALSEGGYIVLDFGEEIQGGAVITVQDAGAGAELRMTFGESVSEALSSIGESNATNDHSPRDFVMKIPRLSNMRFGNTGFRFLKLEAVNAAVTLRSVQAVYEHIFDTRRGYFECSDERINKIWETAVRTVSLCMNEFLWDGIKRDRLVWLGDMHPEVSVICAVFGEHGCVPKSLDFGRDEAPGDRWISTLPSYSYQWLRCQYLWYMQNGDIGYLREQRDYLAGLIRRANGFIKENGDIDIPDKFVDWSAKNTDYEAAGFRAVMALSMCEAKALCEALGEAELANICGAMVKRLKSKCEAFEGNKQITALCALAGLCDMKTAYGIISKDGAAGLSTFLGYYTIGAMAESGHMSETLDLIKEYWGAMLDFGATTFWEDFDIEWTRNASRIDEPPVEGKDDLHADFGRYCYTQLRHSLCHGWAGGPAAFLAHKVLGVEILDAGCKRVRIAPDLGGLTYAKGVYPTPYGDISISHEVVNGEIVSSISAPDEVEIVR